jgi:hypothetical protein
MPSLQESFALSVSSRFTAEGLESSTSRASPNQLDRAPGLGAGVTSTQQLGATCPATIAFVPAGVEPTLRRSWELH